MRETVNAMAGIGSGRVGVRSDSLYSLINWALSADHPQHVPCYGGAGGRGWAYGEAAAEGRKRIPQVQGQEEQLAQGEHWSSIAAAEMVQCFSVY